MRRVAHISIGMACIIMAGYVGFVTPARVEAAVWSSPFEVSGWIPYWRKTQGATDALLHINSFKEVNPFAYSVKQDGSLADTAKMNELPWPLLRTFAKMNHVRYIPTVMWSDSDAIHDVLSDPQKRLAHINHITQMVRVNGFDGVDIDYEGKYAKTKPYFSLFLKELYAAMGEKWVMCTIESRTPLEDRFDTIPSDIEYANDFVEINKYCDRVKIMAYDQHRIDLRLNEASPDPYAPVADIRWVEKVMNLVAQDVSKHKLVLGIPTYGYAWDVFEQNGETKYSKLWAFNPRYATETIAPALNLTPQRHTASGELFISYPATSEPDPTSAVPLPNATRVMFWHDGQAIADKVALAKRLGLRGVAFFKVDGGADAGMWNALK